MKDGLDVVRTKVEALTAKVGSLVLQHLNILFDVRRIDGFNVRELNYFLWTASAITIQ